MMRFTRRAFIASVLLAPGMAYAQQATQLPCPWNPARGSADDLLSSPIVLQNGQQQSARVWLQGRATVLTLFATWCPPCMIEKPLESAFNQRLIAASSRTQIKSMLAFDRTSLSDVSARMREINAGSLEIARASDRAELAAMHVFGFDRARGSAISASRPTLDQIAARLPLTMVLDSSGRVMGDHEGTVKLCSGQSYWTDDAAFEQLRNLP